MCRHPCLPFLLLGLIACGHQQTNASPGRYLVTADPIDVGVAMRLCVAVDPSDQGSVWWWEPGATGCASRSTGPGVFRAEGKVARQSADASTIVVRFRLPTHSTTRPFLDVRLVVAGAAIRALDTQAEVTLAHRDDLNIPEQASPPAQRRP